MFDKSKLNTRRIRVVWLSPNDWEGARGFRYGNVRFSFDWATLIAGKKAFWVESYAYGVPACRILLTSLDYSGWLTPYDPEIGDGPWWLASNGEHYRNGDYCLEFMIEDDLALKDATEVDFVTHHPKRCNIDYKTCRYCGWMADKAGAEFLALLVSRTGKISLPGLIEKKDDEQLRPSLYTYSAVTLLSSRVRKIKCDSHGTVSSTDTQAPALARALLRTLADDAFTSERKQFVACFKSVIEADLAVKDLLAHELGLPDAVFDSPSGNLSPLRRAVGKAI